MRHAGVALCLCLILTIAARAAEVDYQRDVRPILRAHCYSCHGPLKQESGLRLDHVELIRQGGESGSLLPKEGQSLLLAAVRGSGEVSQMPLDADPLSDEQIATLAGWIEAGGPAPDEPLPEDPSQHWSFQKPVRPPLPDVSDADWSTNPIDRFVAAEHQRRGLVPVPLAEKHVLLRRVYLDLIGLPPTSDELRAFLADASPDAYEKVVDRLLADPHYGERWGRHWMDVWRYSDWDGYNKEVRESRPHIWRWRDWIVESLNADRPYDEMIVAMLAADEVAPLAADDQRATGFLVRNWYKFNRNVWLDNTVEHTSKAFLGITLNCARCHDHMYDPIAQREYYAFRAIFEPYDVRTDRVPGESNTDKDGLVRVFDADAERPTYLFARGNEAQPDKEHPIEPAVPQALGGDALTIAAIDLPAQAYYPGLREFVQQETLAQAETEAQQAESAMADSSATLAERRKKLAELAAAQPAKAGNAVAGNGASETEPDKTSAADAPANPDTLAADQAAAQAEVQTAAQAAELAESRMLAAAAKLVAVRAKIAADHAAFASPPAKGAEALAREASRAARVHQVEQARHAVLAAEQKLAQAQQDMSEAGKKKIADAEAALNKTRQSRATAQAALGKAGDTYARFGEVYPQKTSGRRTALARWIASQNNPLTARVAINQMWMRHFGAPLVGSVFDFGLNGTRPTHPELLDWLASEFMENGWRMKAVHRLIVTSRAYRLDSTGGTAANLAADSENHSLWRANPRRMEAEVVRDSTLRVAGSLDATMGGADLDPELGQTLYRRSLYFRSSKEKKMTFLDLFDRASVVDCYRRAETIAPQQALAMVNSPLTRAQARRLAATLADELHTRATSESQGTFVETAFERILCRPPTSDERQACLAFLVRQAERLADPAALESFDPEHPADAFDPHARARENLVHVLFNHNDFVTVR